MSIVIQNLSYTYMKKTPYEQLALDDVSLEIKKGEFVAIIGHSGSGKTTLVQHISGLITPDKGEITIDDIDILQKNHKAQMAKRKVGIVFQYPEHQLFAETVFDDVAFGPRNFELDEQQVQERVTKALEFVGMDVSEIGSRSPFQLSGGQMRRVAIAGVIAMQPDYLILDEPTAGLDPLMRNLFYDEIKNLYKKSNISVILVTHSMEEAIELSNRLLVMYGGKIIIDDKPEKIFTDNKQQLQTAGVDVPDIISLIDCLNEHGFDIEKSCLTKEQLTEQILKKLPKGGK